VPFESWHLKWIDYTVIAQASIDSHHASIESHGIVLQKLGNAIMLH